MVMPMTAVPGYMNDNEGTNRDNDNTNDSDYNPKGGEVRSLGPDKYDDLKGPLEEPRLKTMNKAAG